MIETFKRLKRVKQLHAGELHDSCVGEDKKSAVLLVEVSSAFVMCVKQDVCIHVKHQIKSHAPHVGIEKTRNPLNPQLTLFSSQLVFSLCLKAD